MEKSEVNSFIKEFNSLKTGKKIFEILDKNDKLFVSLGTPGYHDTEYIMVDKKSKTISPVYIFDYFANSKEMDQYVIYSNKGGTK